MKLALFDFDGTITNSDSLPHFLIHSQGRMKVYFGALVLLPRLAAYFLKISSAQATKEKIFFYFFKNTSQTEFQTLCDHYVKIHLPNIIREQALEKIKWHLTQKHRVILVSASIESYLSFWCEQTGIELLGTQMEFDQDRKLLPSFASPNCYGEEKTKRIKALLSVEDYDFIYAYGDSRGDREMLAIANEAHFKPFR